MGLLLRGRAESTRAAVTSFFAWRRISRVAGECQLEDPGGFHSTGPSGRFVPTFSVSRAVRQMVVPAAVDPLIVPSAGLDSGHMRELAAPNCKRKFPRINLA